MHYGVCRSFWHFCLSAVGLPSHQIDRSKLGKKWTDRISDSRNSWLYFHKRDAREEFMRDYVLLNQQPRAIENNKRSFWPLQYRRKTVWSSPKRGKCFCNKMHSKTLLMREASAYQVKKFTPIVHLRIFYLFPSKPALMTICKVSRTFSVHGVCTWYALYVDAKVEERNARNCSICLPSRDDPACPTLETATILKYTWIDSVLNFPSGQHRGAVNAPCAPSEHKRYLCLCVSHRRRVLSSTQ